MSGESGAPRSKSGAETRSRSARRTMCTAALYVGSCASRTSPVQLADPRDRAGSTQAARAASWAARHGPDQRERQPGGVGVGRHVDRGASPASPPSRARSGRGAATPRASARPGAPRPGRRRRRAARVQGGVAGARNDATAQISSSRRVDGVENLIGTLQRARRRRRAARGRAAASFLAHPIGCQRSAGAPTIAAVERVRPSRGAVDPRRPGAGRPPSAPAPRASAPQAGLSTIARPCVQARRRGVGVRGVRGTVAAPARACRTRPP